MNYYKNINYFNLNKTKKIKQKQKKEQFNS